MGERIYSIEDEVPEVPIQREVQQSVVKDRTSDDDPEKVEDLAGSQFNHEFITALTPAHQKTAQLIGLPLLGRRQRCRKERVVAGLSP